MTIGKNGRNVNVEQGKQGFQERKQEEPVMTSIVASASSVVGACPDCGAEMIGRVNDTTMLPGTQCSNCPHTVANIETVTDPDDDGHTYLYSLDDEATIRITDDHGNTVSVYYPEDTDGDWDSALGAFQLKGQGDQIRAALDARADWEDGI